ncbi:MAG: endosialidase [Lachnospiraceae bacterium]|nr:endosialidase [Lachnospiraceae bacterium]
MTSIKELLRAEEDGSISFGDYELDQKTKKADFEFQGDIYKVKTFKEITKLERNDTFVYESVPGTAVKDYSETETGVEFIVAGPDDAQITLGMEDDMVYRVILNDNNIGNIKTSLGGKLSFSVKLQKTDEVKVEIVRVG